MAETKPKQQTDDDRKLKDLENEEKKIKEENIKKQEEKEAAVLNFAKLLKQKGKLTDKSIKSILMNKSVMGYEVSEEEATKIMNELVEKKKPADKENVLENKDKKEVIDGGRALRDMLISKGKTDEEIKSTMKDVEIKLKDNKVGTLTNEEIDALIAEKPSTNKKEGEKKKENKNITKEDIEKKRKEIEEKEKEVEKKKKEVERLTDEILNRGRDSQEAKDQYAKAKEKLAKLEGELETLKADLKGMETAYEAQGKDFEGELNHARDKYAVAQAEYNKTLRKIGKTNWWKRKAFGIFGKPQEMPTESRELLGLRKKYEEALYAHGNDLYKKAEAQTREAYPNASEEEIRETMEAYKANVIFKELVVDEEVRLGKQQAEMMNPKERGVMRQMWDWYKNLSPWKRRALGIAVSATVGGTIVLATGGSAALLGTYLATKAGRTVASTLAGESAAVLTKHAYMPGIKNRQEAGVTMSKDTLEKLGWSRDAFMKSRSEYQTAMANYNSEMASLKRKQMIARMLASGVVALGTSDLFDNHGTSTPGDSPDTGGTPPAPGTPSGPGTGIDPNAIVTGAPGHTGITWALKAQLAGHDDWAQSMANKMGYHGDIHSADFYKTLGQKLGYIDGAGNEVRVAVKGSAYVLDHENFTVTEYAGDGQGHPILKPLEKHGFGESFENKSIQDSYEYDWQKNSQVTNGVNNVNSGAPTPPTGPTNINNSGPSLPPGQLNQTLYTGAPGTASGPAVTPGSGIANPQGISTPGNTVSNGGQLNNPYGVGGYYEQKDYVPVEKNYPDAFTRKRFLGAGQPFRQPNSWWKWPWW